MPDDIAKSPAAPYYPEAENTPFVDPESDRKQKYMAILAGVIVIGAAAFFIQRQVKSASETAGGEALYTANDAAALQAVIKDHSGTAAAASAEILLAEKQWAEGKKDESIATLQKFTNEQPKHPALPTAQASLASKLSAQGKTDEAKQLFEKVAADSSSYIAPYAIIALGDLEKAAGQIDKAEEYYKRVQSDFPSSPFTASATQRLLVVRAKPPVEIDAPASKDVPELNFGTPSSLSVPQLPFETPASPDQSGTPATPGQP